MRYAAYVRVLDLGCSEGHRGRNIIIDPSVYGSLFHMNDSRPLLPRLREMSWSQRGSSDRRIVYLICPTLRRLHIRTKDGADNPRMSFYRSRYHRDIERRRYKEPRRRDYVLRWILREVLPKGVNLEHLTLDGIHHFMLLAPVSRCPRLETLDLPSSLANWNMDVPQLISTLGGIARLTRLTMSVDQGWDIEEDVLQPTIQQFESLETLHLSTRIVKKPQPPALVFATADCQRLRNLTIQFDTEDIEFLESSCLRQVLRTPAGFAHMRTLYVRFQGPVDWRSAPPQLSSFLLPLAPLHKLEQLYIVCEETLFACTDEDIRLITRHWRNLSTFAATFMSQDGNPSARALDHIAHNWPRLEVLCLPSLRDLASFDKHLCPHHSLRHLGILSFVAYREIRSQEDYIEVKNFAVYLSLQFPNLKTGQPFPARLSNDVDHVWKQCHSWGKILEVVQQARSLIRQRSIHCHRQGKTVK